MNSQNKGGVSIIIPNYNGKELLHRYLCSILKATQHFNEQSEVIVIDDASRDGSIEYLRQNFPEVKILDMHSNYGFSRVCNYAAQRAKFPIIIFLNNDVRVDSEFIAPLVKHFEKADIFAVAPKSITSKAWIGNESVSQAFFTKGVFSLAHPSRGEGVPLGNKMRPILYCCGSGFACSKNKFLALGGFDELFSPFYWEDVDLCYRAWKRGWVTFYEPQSIIYHQHGSTILRVSGARKRNIIFLRNAFLFTWKNITSREMFIQHVLYTPFWIFKNLFNFHQVYLIAWFQALGCIKKIISKRRIEFSQQKWSDEKVLKESWL